MGNIVKDIVFALRMLARNPGYTFVVAATLGLGIGANTAIFSLVDGVLLKPLPFRDPDRLTVVWQKSASGVQLGVSELDLNDYLARNRTFQDLAGFTAPATKSAILTGAGNPIEIAPSYISANYFRGLGVSPVLGRDFLPEESKRGSNGVAILGYSLWQSQFGGSRDILNRQITLDKRTLQVVGVMGSDVHPVDADVFLPFAQLNPEQPMPRNYHELTVIGRLRPGLAVADAQRETEALSSDLARSYPATNSGIGAHVIPLRDEITGSVREPILMLLAAVGLVLLIACGNVANLILVRSAGRQKEIAIRVALGAGRRRIIGQFAVECMLLSAVGSIAGVLLAFAAMPLIHTFGGSRIPRLHHIAIDSRVLTFAAAIAVVSGLIFGLLPALRYSSANLNQKLRSGGRTSQFDSGRLRNVLVALEVALALVVVVAAGLMVRSVNGLLDVQPGFRPDHLLVARLALPARQYKPAQVHSFYTRLLPALAAVPGVVSVGASTSLPFAPSLNQTRFAVQGEPLPDSGHYPVAVIASVDTGFFQTMGIPILRGRAFKREELADFDNDQCIINSTLERTFFGGRDAVGGSILTNVAAKKPEPCRVVGVVGDTRVAGLDAPHRPVLYFPSYVPKEMLVIRTTTDPISLAPSLRRVAVEIDPQQPLSGIQTMDEVLSQSLSRRSFTAVLLTLFSAIGLLLAALGLYGVTSYSVAQRTQEIGVRMALGAEPSQIFKLILWQGFRVTAAGLLGGAVAAFFCTRLMSGLLYGIGAADPASYAVACSALITVFITACFIPARRATRVDPLTALRHD